MRNHAGESDATEPIDGSPRCPVCGLDHEQAPGSWYELAPVDRPAPAPTPPELLKQLLQILCEPTYRECVRAALVELLAEPIVDMIDELTQDGPER